MGFGGVFEGCFTVLRRITGFFARTSGRIWKTARVLGWSILGFWAACAAYFNVPLPEWGAALVGLAICALFLLAMPERLVRFRRIIAPVREARWSFVALGAAAVVFVWYFVTVRPDPNQDWASDHARLPRIAFEGDLAHVRDVRDFTWRGADDYSERFHDRTYDLSTVESMHYVVAPMSTVDAVAHVFVCFDFSDGRHIAVSVEGRRRKGQRYQVLPSLFRQFQLIYVIGEERDVVGKRGVVLRQPVRFYPARTSPAHARAILADMLRRADQLEKHPEFYNLFVNNCMTNILLHLRRLGGHGLPSDLAVLLTGLSDRAAYRLGYLDIDITFAQARDVFRIDGWILQHALDETFSTDLREELDRRVGEARRFQNLPE